jgi:hypothetical protein
MEDKWAKLEEIVRRVVREELAGFGKKPKLGFENGRWTNLTKEQMEAWKEAYGAVDIETELKRAAAWIVSNPNLAPKSQHGRFLNTWLSRQQNQSSIRSIPAKQEQPKKLCAYCDQVATGSANGICHCRAHTVDAMDERPRANAKCNVVGKSGA